MVYGLMNTIIKTKTKNTVIAAILYIILNISKRRKKTIICQSNSPDTTTLENYQKIVINCDQVEFCFKMAAILDTILNI